MLCLAARLCPTLCNPMNSGPPGASVHGDSPGKNTEMGCHALQGTYPTQGDRVRCLAQAVLLVMHKQETQLS